MDPSTALAGSWGDPPIVLRCGVRRPAGLASSSSCTVVNGVGWYAERAERGYVFTTIGRAAFVEVSVPSSYTPPATALVDLAATVKKHVPESAPCQ